MLALSGGGARSAAFGYGVLSTLAEQPASEETGRTLADDIAVVAGVSGGGMLAAYLALHGPSGIPAFKRDYLDQDPEASLRTAITPDNLLRGYRGGINDLTGLAAWLDAHLYHGATLGDLERTGGPRLLLHATDLYNRAPFSFDRESFRTICSDYTTFPLSHAVAASAAVPVLFAPVVLENFNPVCPLASGAPATPATGSAVISHLQETQARYATAPDLRYLKLLDGGLVDNLAARNLMRSMRRPAPSPLPVATAREVRRIIVIVADASLRVGGDMSTTTDGPGALDAITASIDAMVDNSSRASLDRLEEETRRWRERLIRWRCDAMQTQDCDKLEIKFVRLSLADIREPETRARILQLHNKLSLKADEVDFLSGLGRRLLVANLQYRRIIAAR
ncbi:patatin-like phospholipase family protein [Bosea sp. F3-2]|uniref:patatin-like phospholipase family protein n=1 Tax=Bosea sp. F3-2 TaxID=2599640 RepID=UPI0016562965|nr:patatin-like phospholipase family protein [Bosea sp. F3-2]